MKLEVEERKISSNIPSKKDIHFSIDNDSYIIEEILRSSIYSDPILCLCREILANSRDAATEAQTTDKPIQVSYLANQFCCKDFGIGISPYRMENYYLRYGASTKRGDNGYSDSEKYLGVWGLGSKAWASYSNETTVETIHAGIKYIYVVFLGENFKGCAKLFSETPTDEPSGTTIKVPIKPGDVGKFKEAVLRTTMFWSVRPTILGELPLPVIKPNIDAESWAIYNHEDLKNYNVIFGEVPFRDNSERIPPGVVLKFKIGELSVTADKSNLRDDEKTRNAINKGLDTYDKEVVSKVESQVSNLETFPEVIKVVSSLPRASVKRTWCWQGKTFDYPSPTHFNYYQISDGYGYRRSYIGSNRTTTLNPKYLTDKSFILIDKQEISSYDKRRIKEYLYDNNLKQVYIIEPGLFPVTGPGLSTIKVKRTTSGGGGKLNRTTIKGRKHGYRRQDDFLIDTPNPILYVLTDIDMIRYPDKLGLTLVQISDKSETFIIDQPNWTYLDDYLKQELWDKITPLEAQEIADRKAANDTYSDYQFLIGYHPDFSCLDFLGMSKKYSPKILSLVEYLVSNQKVMPVTPDIYKKYPLLKNLHLSYHQPESEKNSVKDYVDMINNKILTASGGSV